MIGSSDWGSERTNDRRRRWRAIPNHSQGETGSRAVTPGTLLFSAILTLLIAIPVMATDAVFVAVPAIRDTFSADPGEVQVAMTSYVLAFAVVQLIYGPLSDRHGRRKVLLFALTAFVIGSIMCAMATSLSWLVVARALQGLGSGSGPTLARAILRDRHGAESSIRILSYIMAVFGVIAVVAPIVGGLLVESIGWRSVFIFGALYGSICVALVWYRLDETRPAELAAGHGLARYFRSFAVLARSRYFMFLAAANTAIYAAMFAWIAGAMFVLIEGMGQPADAAGAYYALSIVGFVVGSALGGKLQIPFTPLQVIGGGIVFFLAASLSGWVFSGIREPLAVVGPGFAMMMGIGFVVPPATASGIAPFPEMAGAASALIGFIQMAASSISVLVVGLIFDGTATPMMIMITALGAASLILFLPFLNQLRERMIRR